MLFGTDGIRGEVNNSPENDEEAVSQLLEQRYISSRLMRLVGEALSRIVDVDSNVVVGWDNRPDNPDLVAALTTGLHLGGCVVTHAGVCATPALHNALLETKSALGCMITASHNPVTDSGIKVFDSSGFKTSPDLEKEISELVVQLAAEDRDVDLIHQQELSVPDSHFNADLAHQELLMIRLAEFSGLFSHPEHDELVVDSSKGAASNWLSSFLNQYGISSKEVSGNAKALNENCGAGELSPSDSWTWEEAARSEHIMINSLIRKPPGQIIAGALDGDGDRCLLIQSTETGCRVVDGDEMADHILRSAKGEWHLAASIESDLALMSSLDRLRANVKFSQTAVGDRWLSQALKDNSGNVLGVEDSGHLVMSAPNPNGGRCLVGDGVASLLIVLCAMSCQNRVEPFERGYKQRTSITNSVRSRWTGSNALADTVEHIATMKLGPVKRQGLVGESNLMLLETEGISIGIRNSGTQAKTNVSLRISPGRDHTSAVEAVEMIIKTLKESLVD
jgi:phosphoglucosamine mutase